MHVFIHLPLHNHMLLSAMCTQHMNKLGNVTGQLQQGRKNVTGLLLTR